MSNVDYKSLPFFRIDLIIILAFFRIVHVYPVMQNILITGGSGFIGGHLVERLSSSSYNDYEITVIDNLSTSNNNPIKKYRSPSYHNNDNLSFYKLDITNKVRIAEIFKLKKIDTCIHLAAKTSVQQSIINPELTVDTNVKGTLNVLEACSKNKIKNFVFASSAAVYGKPERLPVSEDCIGQELLSPYAASKVAAEALVSSYRNLGKIRKAISLRFFNVYGENQNEEYAGVITKFAMRLSKGLAPIIYGDGKQTRDFIFVEDVVDAIILSAQYDKTIDSSAVFNIGRGVPVRINDLAQRMIRIFGLDLKPIYRQANKGDIKDSYADMTKSKRILKFTAHKDFDQGLREVKGTLALKNR
jgi:UDP-glucose 4-epimerase